eukprot:346288-Amphidinium_carterae.1
MPGLTASLKCGTYQYRNNKLLKMVYVVQTIHSPPSRLRNPIAYVEDITQHQAKRSLSSRHPA